MSNLDRLAEMVERLPPRGDGVEWTHASIDNAEAVKVALRNCAEELIEVARAAALYLDGESETGDELDLCVAREALDARLAEVLNDA